MAFLLLPTLLQDWFDYSKGEASARAAGFIIAATRRAARRRLARRPLRRLPGARARLRRGRDRRGGARRARAGAADRPGHDRVPHARRVPRRGQRRGLQARPARSSRTNAGAAAGIVGAAGGLGGFFPPVFVGLDQGRRGHLHVRVRRPARIRRASASRSPSGCCAPPRRPSCAGCRTRGECLRARCRGGASSAAPPRRRAGARSSAKGREWESFYRDRWQHDRVVRSTHGVNCTGSCSWKIHVKDGIVAWETQQTDYPSNGPDVPEYEPRGCPRGASFSWYVYSPLRVRYPYVRGVLLDLYREALARTGDPVEAWADDRRGSREGAQLQVAARQGRLRARLVGRGRRPDRGRARPHDPPLRARPRRRLLADPGDVDGLLLRRHALPLADRRGLPQLLRLVRRPAARLAAGLGRPDRRARVGRLVELGLR